MLWLVLVAILLGNSLHVQKIVHIGGASGKGSTHQCSRCKRYRFDPWVAKIPWRRKWQPTPVFLPRKSHGQMSLVGYSPKGLQRIGHNWMTWGHIIYTLRFISLFHTNMNELNVCMEYVFFLYFKAKTEKRRAYSVSWRKTKRSRKKEERRRRKT